MLYPFPHLQMWFYKILASAQIYIFKDLIYKSMNEKEKYSPSDKNAALRITTNSDSILERLPYLTKKDADHPAQFIFFLFVFQAAGIVVTGGLLEPTALSLSPKSNLFLDTHLLTCPLQSHGSLKSTYSSSLLYIPKPSLVGFCSESTSNFILAMLSKSFERWRWTCKIN